MNSYDLFASVEKLLADGIPVALTTIVETRGSTPREVGAKMAVLPNGVILGSVGGGCGEATVKLAALRILNQTQKPEVIAVDLAESTSGDEGDVCGGLIRVFIEPLLPGSEPEV